MNCQFSLMGSGARDSPTFTHNSVACFYFLASLRCSLMAPKQEGCIATLLFDVTKTGGRHRYVALWYHQNRRQASLRCSLMAPKQEGGIATLLFDGTKTGERHRYVALRWHQNRREASLRWFHQNRRAASLRCSLTSSKQDGGIATLLFDGTKTGGRHLYVALWLHQNRREPSLRCSLTSWKQERGIATLLFDFIRTGGSRRYVALWLHQNTREPSHVALTMLFYFIKTGGSRRYVAFWLHQSRRELSLRCSLTSSKQEGGIDFSFADFAGSSDGCCVYLYIRLFRIEVRALCDGFMIK